MNPILNESSLLDLEFKKVQFKTAEQKSSTYYYKQGLYLESLNEGVYMVFDRKMNVIGVVDNMVHIEILFIAKKYPIYLN